MSIILTNNKKYSLYRYNYHNNPIYFIVADKTLLYGFVILKHDGSATFLIQDSTGNNFSIKFLFNIDEINYMSTELIITTDNYESLGKLFDSMKIEKTEELDSIANKILSSSIDGTNNIQTLNLYNYKLAKAEEDSEQLVEDKKEETVVQVEKEMPLRINKKEVDAEDKKQEISKETVKLVESPISSPVEETKIEPSEEKIESEKESAIIGTKEEIIKKPMKEITEEIVKIKERTKSKIDSHYFVGYLVDVKDNPVTESYNWEYRLNANRQPMKVYFSPKDFTKILTTHMFISGKTGSGKTSFNNSLIHSLLYHGVSVFAFDIKTSSIDYSATIINQPETPEKMLSEMNDSKYKGILTQDKNIMFSKSDVPNEALELINSKPGFKNRFGKKIEPIVLYNNPDESENIKSFTAINILDNYIRHDLIEYSRELSIGNDVSGEYNATRMQYKEGIEQMLLSYFKVLSMKSSYNVKRYLPIISESITLKIINFMEKTGFRLFPSNEDFENWLLDYSVFGKDLKPESEEVMFLNNMKNIHIAKRIIDFENGINLSQIIKRILFEQKTNFYVTIKTNTDLVGFYIIYLYYLLLKAGDLKLKELEKDGCYTTIFIDEAHYLSSEPLLEKVLVDAQRTDRMRNRGWIFSAQRVFLKGFSAQESIGNYILFAQQSADIFSQKTKFSKIFGKEVMQFIGTQNFSFTYDNGSLFVDEDGNYLPRMSVAIKSLPNRAFIEDISAYGIAKYAANIKPYLAQDYVSENEFNISTPQFKIGFDILNDDGKLVINYLSDEDNARLKTYLADVIDTEFAEILSNPDLNKKRFSTRTLQFLEKLLLLIEVNKDFSIDAREIIDDILKKYRPDKNRDLIMKVLKLSEKYKNEVK